MNNYNTSYNPFYNGYNFYSPENALRESNSKSLSRIYSNLGWGLCALYAILTVSQIFVLLISTFVGGDMMSHGWFIMFLTDVPLYGVSIWALLFFTSKLEAKKPKRKKFGFGSFVAAIPIMSFIMFAGSIVGSVVHSIMQQIMGVEINDALTETTSAMSLPAQIIFLVVIAPLGEELIFRKLFLDRTARYGEGAAIFYSALTFALFHGNTTQLFYAFGAGLLLAYVYVRTGSYLCCAFLHAVANALFGIVFPYFSQLIYSSEEALSGALAVLSYSMYFLEWMLIIAGLVILIVFLACKKVYVEKSEYALLKSPAYSAFSNASFIVFAALIGLTIFASYLPQQ